MIKTIVRKNTYMDSIFLMQATKAASGLDGVKEAVIVMGTDVNKSVLSDVNRLTGDAKNAGPSDLIISLDVENEDAANAVIRYLDDMKKAANKPSQGDDGARRYPTVRLAKQHLEDAKLAIISIPGEYAAAEAKKALFEGLNVFIFSDNVSLEDEVALKKLADEKNLYVMGPSSGNAVINGISIGLMSVSAKGRIGIVGASGSGIHEIAALVTQAGQGISQAVGTGGRDLSKEVGGATMIKAFHFLKQDPNTDIIVLVSKPPHPETAEKIYALVKQCEKPVVIYFLGGDPVKIRESGAYSPDSLEQAAAMAVSLARGEKPETTPFLPACEAGLVATAKEERAKLSAGQTMLRGLFCGGTHTEESILIIQKMLGNLHANVGFGGATLLGHARKSVGNSVIDMGDEEFTKGKPHPVMDPSILSERFIAEGDNPEVAVILFDLLLGYGAHADPVGQIEEAITKITGRAAAAGRHLCLIASITGTDLDPQILTEQQKRLSSLGVRVMKSNAQAAMLAGLIVRGE